MNNKTAKQTRKSQGWRREFSAFSMILFLAPEHSTGNSLNELGQKVWYNSSCSNPKYNQRVKLAQIVDFETEPVKYYSGPAAQSMANSLYKDFEDYVRRIFYAKESIYKYEEMFINIIVNPDTHINDLNIISVDTQRRSFKGYTEIEPEFTFNFENIKKAGLNPTKMQDIFFNLWKRFQNGTINKSHLNFNGEVISLDKLLEIRYFDSIGDLNRFAAQIIASKAYPIGEVRAFKHKIKELGMIKNK